MLLKCTYCPSPQILFILEREQAYEQGKCRGRDSRPSNKTQGSTLERLQSQKGKRRVMGSRTASTAPAKCLQGKIALILVHKQQKSHLRARRLPLELDSCRSPPSSDSQWPSVSTDVHRTSVKDQTCAEDSKACKTPCVPTDLNDGLQQLPTPPAKPGVLDLTFR